MRKNGLLLLLIAATKGKLRLQKRNWYIIFSYYFPACDIWYMREPVSTVQCNPFSGASMIALQCVVQAPVSAGPRLDIVWFFDNTGGNTVPINMNTFPPLLSIASQNQTVMNEELIEQTSTITLGRFSDPIHAGRYYCQAQVDGATSSLTPSNTLTFTVSDPVFSSNPCGDSSGGMGLEDFTQASTRCAGSISSSSIFVPPSSTVTPTSTSQSSHSTSTPPIVLSSVLATSPTTDNIFSIDITTTVSTQFPGGRLSLSLWVYVLVGVAAVFAMIILVLTILYIGLCLKKNKTTDSFKRELAKLSRNFIR